MTEASLLHISGPNGCGKTTLMAILARLIQPNTGRISYSSSCNFEYLPPEANGHYLKMDALQNLRFWLQLRGAKPSDDEIFSELERWKLDHPLVREHFMVEKFSTGMKRRLGLARVALSKAALWLLDEPLTGLDEQAVSEFCAMLKSHLGNNGAAIIISHDLTPLKPFITDELPIKRLGA